MLIEFDEQDNVVFDEILHVLERHPSFKQLKLNDESVLSLPGLDIYNNRRKVYCNGYEMNLTTKEYDLLKLFAENRGKVLTYEQVYENVWKEFVQNVRNSTIHFHVNNLKKKIISFLPDAKFKITNLREVGYRLDIIS